MLYGYKFLDENYIVLNEMNFSKKDLQNPETINKILNKKAVYKNVAVWLDVLLVILGVAVEVVFGIFIGADAVFVGFPTLSIIIGYIFTATNDLPDKVLEKNYYKYIEQVKSYKAKCLAKLEKESNDKKKQEIKETISNLNKVLKAINDRKKQADNEKNEKKVEAYIKDYNNAINILKEGKYYDNTWELDLNFIGYYKYFGISEQQFLKAISKNSKINKNVMAEWIDDEEEFEKHGDKKFTGDYISLYSNDDNELFLLLSDMNVYEVDTEHYYDNGDKPKKVSLFKFAEEFSEQPLSIKDKSLIEADKRLGYYIFSDCPEQVKKKPLPF